MKLSFRSISISHIVTLGLMASSGALHAGNTWDGGGSDNLWGTAANWNPDGTPTPGSGNILNFAGTIQLNSFNNYTAFDDWGQILFNSGAGAFTITGNAIDLFGKIENSSTSTQTFNMTIGTGTLSGSFIELNPVSGDLNIGGSDVFLNNNQLRIWGNNGKTLTFGASTIISGSGAGNSVAINQNSTVVYQSVHTYSGDTFVNAGKLQFSTGASANNSVIRIGDTAATAVNAEVDLTAPAGGLTLASIFNVRAGNAGTALIASQNTSGTNILSNQIALDKALTISQSSGGTLNITQTKGVDNTTGFDIKGNTLTLAPAATGTINLSGTLYNSTGTGTITQNGAGTTTLSGTNTYGGITTISAGTLQIGVGGTTGSLGAGSVTNHGALIFNRSNALSVSNLISGSGSLRQNGSGNLTISGLNTFTGGTTIASGTVTLGADSTFANSLVTAGPLGVGAVTLSNGINLDVGASSRTLGATTINLNGDITLGTSASRRLIMDGAIDLGGGTRTVTLVRNGTASNQLTSGNEAFKLFQAGTASTPATFGPAVTVANGTLKLVSDASVTTTYTSVKFDVVTGGSNVTFTGNAGLTIGNRVIAFNQQTQPFGTGANTGPKLTVEAGGYYNMSNGGASSNSMNVFSLAGAGTLTNLDNNGGTGTITITGSDATVFSGSLVDGGGLAATLGVTTPTAPSLVSLVQAGSGSLTLSGNNSGASGGITLTTGTLNVNSANALGTGGIGLAAPGILDNTSGSAVVNAANNTVTWTGVTPAFFTFGTSSSTAANNLDLGTGSVLAASSRTMSFAGTGSTLTMGTLDITSGTNSRTITFDQTGTGNTMVLRGFKISSGAAAAVVNNLAGTANLTISGLIENGSAFDNGINVNGTGITSFNGANSYSGATTIGSGATLKIGTATALGTTTNGTTVSSGGVLELNGQTVGNETLGLSGTGISGGGALSNSTGAASLSGPVTLNANTTIGVATLGNSITLSGNIGESGSRSLTKIGEGKLILTGTNTYSGVTKISAGTLQVNGPQALSSTSTLNSGGSLSDTTVLNLATADPGYTMNQLSIGGVMRFTGPVTGSSTITFTAGGGITGSADKRINVASNVNVVVNGTFFDLIGSTGNNNRDTELTVDGAMTFNAAIRENASGTSAGNIGSLTKKGTGTLTLTASNTYAGPTIVAGGTLALSGIGALGDTSQVRLTSSVFDISAITGSSETIASLVGNAGSTVALGVKNLAFGIDNADTAFSGNISGTNGSITKQGTGTTTLSGTNTYSGNTNISGGTLLLGSSTALSAASVTLSGGTLAVGGNTSSSGTLSLNGSSVIDLNNASHLTFADIGTWSGVLSVWNWTGTLATAGGPTTSQLLFTANTNSVDLSSVNFYSGSGTGLLGGGGAIFVGGGLTGELVPVPEPAAIVSGIMLLGLICLRERRHR